MPVLPGKAVQVKDHIFVCQRKNVLAFAFALYESGAYEPRVAVKRRKSAVYERHKVRSQHLRDDGPFVHYSARKHYHFGLKHLCKAVDPVGEMADIFVDNSARDLAASVHSVKRQPSADARRIALRHLIKDAVFVFARRFTIHTMKLVGATRAFIRAPFLRGAVLQGLAASALAIGMLWAVLAALKRSFPELFTVIGGRTLPMVCGIVLVCGVLLCVISTYFVVNKLVAASKADLYY